MGNAENRFRLPPVGFGTADLGESVRQAVYCAIRSGYRLIDTAQVYGSEDGVGEAVECAIRGGYRQAGGSVYTDQAGAGQAWLLRSDGRTG